MTTDRYQNRYRIPSARATWHHYSGGEYFVTICTAHRQHYFGEIRNGVMILNQLGQKLDDFIRDIPNHHSYAIVPVYQVMPNHLHLIVCIDNNDGRDAACHILSDRDAACHVSTKTEPKSESEPETTPIKSVTDENEKMRAMAQNRGLLSVAMGNLKSALTKYAHANEIEFGWQTRFHDHIIRDQHDMNRIATYIENNPATWMLDRFYSE